MGSLVSAISLNISHVSARLFVKYTHRVPPSFTSFVLVDDDGALLAQVRKHAIKMQFNCFFFSCGCIVSTTTTLMFHNRYFLCILYWTIYMSRVDL